MARAIKKTKKSNRVLDAKPDDKNVAKSGDAKSSDASVATTVGKTAKTSTAKALSVKTPVAKNANVSAQEEAGADANWTFLTNHTHVLICLSNAPDLRLRDVAERVGITERAVQRIVFDLERGGVLSRNRDENHRDGRRKRYDVDLNRVLRHPIEAHCTVRDLMEMTKPNNKKAE